MISFRRPLSDDEIALEQEIRGYYGDVQAAFAVGNAETLALLFSASITHPMTQAQISDWAKDYFGRNGRARFKIVKAEIQELGRERAVVDLRYKVETSDHKEDFGGEEIDTLERRSGRWYIAGWEKVAPAR